MYEVFDEEIINECEPEDIFSPSVISITSNSLVKLMDQLRQDETSFLKDVQKRKDLRTTFWLATIINEDIPITARLRASELSAKADSDFVERKELTLIGGYREMVLNSRNKLKELTSTESLLDNILEADYEFA